MAIQQAGEHAYGVQWSEWYSEQQYGDEHTQRRCIRVCQCREEPEKQTFVIAPMPEMIIPKGMASESLLADILIDKYVYHLPFYRVMQKYKELGVLLSDSTIRDWFAAVCSKLLPLYDSKHIRNIYQSEELERKTTVFYISEYPFLAFSEKISFICKRDYQQIVKPLMNTTKHGSIY